MKVYVVSDGAYSEYSIERIFYNKPAAEEYKKWHNITNDIEEYEVYDEPFTQSDGERCMLIRIDGTVYPEAVVGIKFYIEPKMCTAGSIWRKGQGIYGYQRNDGVFSLYLYRAIPINNWDEDLYKNRLTKALYDLSAVCKNAFAEGASVQDVEHLVRTAVTE